MTNKLAQFGVLAVAMTFFGYWALLVYCDVWRPLPLGLRLSFDGDRVLVVETVPGGAAQRAGLRVGDRLALLDGHPIVGRLDWLTVETNLEIGRTVPLSVDRAGVVLAAPLVTPTFASWSSWRSRRGPALLVVRAIQLVSLLLALMVGLKRSRDPIALVGAMLLATISVFSLTLPVRLASVWRALPILARLPLWLPFMSGVTVAGWACTFFWIFPRARVRSRWVWCAIWLPLVPGLVGHAVFGYQTLVRSQLAPPRLPWAESLLVVGVVDVISGLCALVWTYRGLDDVNERRRVRVIMTGSLIGAVAGMPVVLAYWRTSTNSLDQSFLAAPFATLGTFLFLVMPLSFAYAILRHRLFDIRVMIRQGLRYALARRALFAAAPALLALLSVDLLTHGDEPVDDILRSHVWWYVSCVGLAVVARTQRQGWLDALDRRFFRERYNAQRLLRGVADDIRQAKSLAPVAPTVVARIEQALHPAFVAMLVRDHNGRRYRTVAASPTGMGPTSLDASNKLLALVRLLGAPLDMAGSDTEWLARQMPLADTRAMQAATIELVVPVGAGDHDATGLLVLGSKRSEEPYSEDDRELLMAIADSVSIRLPALEVGSSGSERVEECPTCGGCFARGTGQCRTDGAALVAGTAPRVLAGRYRLERRLGRGGMGTVYAALDTSLDRRVAVKLVRDDLVGLPETAARFQREARIAGAFSHPNVVTVHDVGVDGTHAFLVMELLEGRTLRDVLRADGRVEWARALPILKDVVAAVEAAHRQRLLHRDLKPENVGLVSDGSAERAKVLDFGIAKFLTPMSDHWPGLHTTGGALLGTPSYMAPEQLRGEDPDPSWDLWALTVMAYEMLTGLHPFMSLTVLRDTRACESDPDPRLAHLPRGCVRVFARGLAIDRTVRPESPAVFLANLERSFDA